MNPVPRIQLLTLSSGERLLRMEDEHSGLSLERKLNPQLATVAQKEKMLRLFGKLIETEPTVA
jgi:hypothetical protein